jgi:hypothetical protein
MIKIASKTAQAKVIEPELAWQSVRSLIIFLPMLGSTWRHLWESHDD